MSDRSMKETLPKPTFDPAVFLANAGLGRKIVTVKRKAPFSRKGM